MSMNKPEAPKLPFLPWVVDVIKDAVYHRRKEGGIDPEPAHPGRQNEPSPRENFAGLLPRGDWMNLARHKAHTDHLVDRGLAGHDIPPDVRAAIDAAIHLFAPDVPLSTFDPEPQPEGRYAAATMKLGKRVFQSMRIASHALRVFMGDDV
jgi:hypothetical protein